MLLCTLACTSTKWSPVADARVKALKEIQITRTITNCPLGKKVNKSYDNFVTYLQDLRRKNPCATTIHTRKFKRVKPPRYIFQWSFKQNFSRRSSWRQQKTNYMSCFPIEIWSVKELPKFTEHKVCADDMIRIEVPQLHQNWIQLGSRKKKPSSPTSLYVHSPCCTSLYILGKTEENSAKNPTND